MREGSAWYSLPVADVLAGLDTGMDGLSSGEAARRLAERGPNELRSAGRVSPWTVLGNQFRNVLIVILIVATVLSGVLGEAVEAAAIAIIVLLAVMLGFVQEYRAERAIEALRRLAALSATALRDGEEREIPARELVPGDLILLRAGDIVPADARVIESANLQTDEAALTGESVPVEKDAKPLPAVDLPIADRRNIAHSGTVATYGRGVAAVIATGMDTEFGMITGMLQAVEATKTPLQENLDALGKTLAKVALAIVSLIVVMGLVRGQPFLEMFVFGIALAVAVVPEALPAVVTISLAIGVQRMVRRNALVRRLPAVEALGGTTVICSDKTGTLTRDEMTVRKILAGGRVIDVSGSGYEPEGEFADSGVAITPGDAVLDLLRAGALASDARLVTREGHWEIKGDPTEGALVVAAAKAGLDKVDLETALPRVNEIPFTSETKRMTSLHAVGDTTVAYTKGAAEIILASCTHLRTTDGTRAIEAADRELIAATGRDFASHALRVLGVAAKPGASIEDAEDEMTWLGLVGMIDPPRPEVRSAVEACNSAGIRVAMITGDHPITAEAVAAELGLLHGGRVVTGAELEAMSDAELEAGVDEIDVYARVSPEHKLRVVTALQRRGHVVAMTGDGVNDAPALKRADIGIAMGITGTDVSKEAAAMTLTDDNFASIVAAVEEGRSIFGNIKKYLMYLISSNIGEIGVMAGATLLNLPLPLSAVQLLYVNLVTDGLPALALSVDPPEADLMQRKPRDSRGGIFTRPVVALMSIGGLWSTIANLALFVWALHSGRTLSEAMTMTFVSLVLIQFVKAYNYRSDRTSVFVRPLANKWLNLAIVSQLALLALVVYWPVLHDAFGTYYLTLDDWLIVTALAVTVSPVLEIGKWLVRSGRFGESS